MAKNRGKVIKRRLEGLLCNSLKETHLHDDTLRPAQIKFFSSSLPNEEDSLIFVKEEL